MRIFVLLLAAMLAACGGGGSDLVRRAEVRVASNGCIMASNEEASFEYALGGSNRDKHLIWNCTEYDYHKSSFVELLTSYSPVDGCFKVVDTHVASGKCNAPAAAPKEIVRSATITAENSVHPKPEPDQELRYKILYWGKDAHGRNRYELFYGPEIKNNGNVRLFGVRLDVRVEGVRVAQHERMSQPLDPQTGPTAFQPAQPLTYSWYPLGGSAPQTFFTEPNVYAGGEYEVTLTLTDRYGNVLDQRRVMADTEW